MQRFSFLLPKKTYFHLDKCFEFTANLSVIEMFQRDWIEGLAYKENQALENQKTRKSLENQRKSVTRKIRPRRKNPRG